MTRSTATQLVADDQRRSYPHLTDAEAVARVVDTVSADQVDRDGSDLSRAYLTVLGES